MDIFSILRQFFLFKIIIVKHRKVVNAAERRIRTYSELEGLQHACTLVYCAASTPQGVLAQLRREQGGKVRSSTVLAPADSFGRVMRLLRYLCENGVGPEQWLEVLEDVHQPYQLLDTSKNAINIAEEPVFCGICRF